MRTKVMSPSGTNFFGVIHPLSRITLDVDYIIFVTQYLTLILSVHLTYEFTSGMMIPHLTYLTYAQMDVFVL